MKPLVSLEGKRVLITGASSGIGRACAEMAAGLGASTVLVARRGEVLEAVRAGMVCPDRHICIAADLTEGGAEKLVFDQIRDSLPLDGIVHAAGIAPILPIGVLSDDMALEALRLNLLSFLQWARFFSKKRNGRDGGSIVAVSSVAAKTGWPTGSVYCASKGGISAAVPALALELAPRRIRVNAVLPSYIDTAMYSGMQKLFGEKTRYNDPDSLQPLGLGQPEQVAAPVCFLLSDAASFITGVNLPVDGGYLAH